ncbi:hypothetical protein JOC85_001037 [Bacillus mesophilus]|uniref:Uncharacterized protein n=1 Tax=Bacillus mesophilus TaxID=1808955 RepID=A0A6M0Q3M3_9BACI|nr:hypothetical protein [Bacillus mesophilus]MBM7660270.1 hypothetical protein [Bacillus mesophilus]NEY70985.1 hypothetical protein [Bacillus mesophilus]
MKRLLKGSFLFIILALVACEPELDIFSNGTMPVLESAEIHPYIQTVTLELEKNHELYPVNVKIIATEEATNLSIKKIFSIMSSTIKTFQDNRQPDCGIPDCDLNDLVVVSGSTIYTMNMDLFFEEGELLLYINGEGPFSKKDVENMKSK